MLMRTMKTLQNSGQLSASFRDPSGFLFNRDNVLYRQVNRKYEQEYLRLMELGLYEKLVKARLLIPHVEADHVEVSQLNVSRLSSRSACPSSHIPMSGPSAS